jgi:hypothetical protein
VALNREKLDELRTEDVPLVFTPRCHPDGGTLTAYVGGGLMQVDCIECGAKVVEFEVAEPEPGQARGLLEQIIYAGDGCQGHRDCNHSMEPWQKARGFLALPQSQTDPPCPSCGWAMSDHGDPPMCPPVPGEPVEGGSRR